MLPLPDDRLRITVTIDPDNWVDPDSSCKLVEVDRSFFVRCDLATNLKHFLARSDKTTTPNEEALTA
jgi:hypothetical protein